MVVMSRPSEVRCKEFMRAMDVLDYQGCDFLHLEDGRVGADMAYLVQLLDLTVKRYQPDELYVPFPSLHQDHIATYEAGVRAGRLSMTDGHWFTPSIYVYDVSAYDVGLYPTDLRWNVFESLSEAEIDKKEEAMACYLSEWVTGPHPAKATKQQAAVVGAARQVAWAEPFACVRTVRP